MPSQGIGQIAVVGTSYRRVGFRGLGELVLPPDDDAALHALAQRTGAVEAVYVATCNRVEVYLLLDHPAEADLPDKVADVLNERLGGRVSGDDLFLYTGQKAVSHLFRVVSSLDSLALGECEIAGQVRRAAERARDAGLLGEGLRPLFRRAAHVARQVRQETAIGRTPVSIASLVTRLVKDHFGGQTPERAVFIGVGDMTRKVANALKGRTELVFVNRTLSRAQALAERLGGRAVALEEFRAKPPEAFDLLVTATQAPEPVVGPDVFKSALAMRARLPRPKKLLVCDLGVPADVDPAVEDSDLLRRVALHDLEKVAAENQTRLEGEAAHARALVEQETASFSEMFRLRTVAAESVEALLRDRLGHLEGADRDAVRAFTVGLAERLGWMAQQPVAASTSRRRKARSPVTTGS